MLKPDTRISLADLAAVGLKLRTPDAVAIVRELLQQVTHGQIPGVPSPHVIRISPQGDLFVEGPVAAGSRPVSRAAQLLETLLPPFDAAAELRVPGALRLILARAMGTLDLPPYPSLDAFAEALQRFSPPDTRIAMRDLVSAWASAAFAAAESHVPAEQAAEEESSTEALLPAIPDALTISDIRRARRATGLPLAEIAARSRIPVELLRQLEWGYLRNWPGGLYGRTQLVRYARASGLDEQLVVKTAWPMLEAAQPPVVSVAEPEPETVETKIEPEVEEPAAVASVPAAIAAPAPAPVAASAPAIAASAAAAIAPPASMPAATAPPASAPAPRPETVVVEAVPVVETVPVQDPGEIPIYRVAGDHGAPRRRNRMRAGVLVAAAAALLMVVLPAVRDRLEQPPPPRVEATVADRVPTSGAPAPATDLPPAAVNEAPPQAPSPAPVVIQPDRDVPVKAGSPRPITEDPIAYSPSFATSGSAVFYQVEGEQGSALVRGETGPEGSILRITRVVDDNAKNYHARPSPDGQMIAFDSDREGERGVFVANADGSSVRRVSGEGYAAVPSWSPDGRTLAFVRAEPDRPKVWNLWTVDLDSGDMRRLTSHPYGTPWGGSWFPDGRRIAYSWEERLVILDLETNRQKIFESPRKGRLVRTPAVSPDGRRVIFQVYRDGAWLLDLDDGSMRKILADPTAEEYAWSPDGRRVAYHSRRSGQWGVWLMAAR